MITWGKTRKRQATMPRLTENARWIIVMVGGLLVVGLSESEWYILLPLSALLLFVGCYKGEK